MSFFNLVFSYDENIVCKIFDHEKEQLEKKNKSNIDNNNKNIKPVIKPDIKDDKNKNDYFKPPEIDDPFFYA